MVVSSIALVLLMAAAAGLPAVWLIREQLDRHAWSQVEQGRLAAQALYAVQQSELAGLATLAAQRPTLGYLLVDGDQDALSAYLATLREGSGLDLVLVCDAGQLVSHAGESIAVDYCAESLLSNFYVVPAGPVVQAWHFASHVLANEAGDPLGSVVVGLALDDEFARQMRSQTGLEHALLVDGEPVATSLAARKVRLPAAGGDAAQGTYTLAGRPYYAARFPLDGAGPEAEVALDVAEITMTQRRLVLTLAGSILAVGVVASLLGTYLARRIGRPLARLADAAGAMSREDLDRPLAVETRVREIALLAQALENARADLNRSLAELRQEKAWTDHLLDAIVEGIATLDQRGRVTFFSRGAERITGWQRDEAVGSSCDRVFRPIETDEPFSKLIPVPGHRRKILVELRDGRQVTLAVTGAQLFSPERGNARVALVFRDVSEEEAVHRLLGHFLANVAHEFRTPLSSLAASVELLLDQAPDLQLSELEELLTALHLGVLGLQTLIDNLLESASIEAGHFRVQPRPSNLGDIIAEALRTMQPLLDKREQRLVVELPVATPVVQADPRRTTQVLVNLLSNASKYGPDDAEIEVRAVVAGDRIQVSVSDSGPGVSANYRKDLFRRFVHPISGSDLAQVGVGLGLSVVKAVVEAQGGQVGVNDREGGGSLFWFTLPMASP